MSRSRHTEAQIIGVLNSWKRDVKRKTWRGRQKCRNHTICAWKAK
jgi:hypothetical protein